MSHMREVGDKAEEELAGICRSLGYSVERVHNRHLPYDAIVNGLRVQIKHRSAEKGRRDRYRFKTYLSGALPAYSTSDTDFFALRYESQWFVFPATAVARCDGTIKNSQYVRRVCHYRNAFALLSPAHSATAMPRIPTQRRLFGGDA